MKTKLLTTALTLSVAASAAMAEVPASQAAHLGADLTPMGQKKPAHVPVCPLGRAVPLMAAACSAVMMVARCRTRSPARRLLTP